MNKFIEISKAAKANPNFLRFIIIGLASVTLMLSIFLFNSNNSLEKKIDRIVKLENQLKSSELTNEILKSASHDEEKQLELNDIAPKLDLTTVTSDYVFYKKWVTKRPYDEEKGQQGIKKLITLNKDGSEDKTYDFDDIKLLQIGLSASIPEGLPSYDSETGKSFSRTYTLFTLIPYSYQAYCYEGGCNQERIQKQENDYNEFGGLWIEDNMEFRKVLSPSQIKKDIGIDLQNYYLNISNIAYIDIHKLLITVKYTADSEEQVVYYLINLKDDAIHFLRSL